MIPPKRFDISPPWLGDAQKIQVRSDFSLNIPTVKKKNAQRVEND